MPSESLDRFGIYVACIADWDTIGCGRRMVGQSWVDDDLDAMHNVIRHSISLVVYMAHANIMDGQGGPECGAATNILLCTNSWRWS